MECDICHDDFGEHKLHEETARVMNVTRDNPDELLVVCNECWSDPERVEEMEAIRKPD